MADAQLAERLEVRDLADELGGRVAARVGGVQPIGVGQQDQARGADQDRHLRGQEVVVPEGDLVGRGRVVLVDDRDHAPIQQPAQRLAGVEVVRARAHVEERQQHLRARHAARAQQLVVDAVELALADRAGGLQLVDPAGAQRKAHHAHPARDRPAGDEHDVVARGVTVGRLGADALQHIRAQLAGVLGDDAGAELDHEAGHGPPELTRAAVRSG